MKKDIHPTYYDQATVICVCGNVFTVGSTMEKIEVEICSACHPFYTGKQKLVDSARRIEKFKDREAKKATAGVTRKGRQVKKAKQRELKANKKAKAEVEKPKRKTGK